MLPYEVCSLSPGPRHPTDPGLPATAIDLAPRSFPKRRFQACRGEHRSPVTSLARRAALVGRGIRVIASVVP